MHPKELLQHPFAHAAAQLPMPARRKIAEVLDAQINWHLPRSFQEGPLQGWHQRRGERLSKAADIISPLPNAHE